MALDLAEVTRVLQEAAAADANRKEVRRGLSKIHGLIQGLDIAIGEVMMMLDGEAPAPREKKPYTGKPRGRKKKVDNTTGSLDLDSAPAQAAPAAAAAGKASKEPETKGGKRAYLITVDGLYRMFNGKYTEDKDDAQVKVFSGDPENMKKKMMEKEGVSEDSIGIEYV